MFVAASNVAPEGSPDAVTFTGQPPSEETATPKLSSSEDFTRTGPGGTLMCSRELPALITTRMSTRPSSRRRYCLERGISPQPIDQA